MKWSKMTEKNNASIQKSKADYVSTITITIISIQKIDFILLREFIGD